MDAAPASLLVAIVSLALAVSACTSSGATESQARADAGMQFGTMVVARDLGLATSAPVRDLEDLPSGTLNTGYRGTRLVDVFFADGIYCIAVGPAPGAAEGSQDAWVTAGVGSSRVRQRIWEKGVTTCDEALDGIRDARADESERAKQRRMARVLDRSRVTGPGTAVLEGL